MRYSDEEVSWYNHITNLHGHKEIFYTEDLILVPLFLFFIFLYLYRKRNKQPVELRKYYIPGYLVKILGLIVFITYHKLLYSGGVDSFSYYWAGNQIYNLFKIDPISAIQLIFAPLGTFDSQDFNLDFSPFIFASNEAMTCKISGLANMLTLGSYTGVSLLLSLFCFSGCWKIYLMFYRLFPEQKKGLAIACLFIPSIFFWSSALSKEIICIGALGYLFNSFLEIFVFKQSVIKNIIIILFMSYLIYNVKLYILIAFIPAVLTLVTMITIVRIENKFLKLISMPVLFLMLVGGLVIAYISAGDALANFSVDLVLESAKVNYEYLSQEGFAESRYDIGEFEPTVAGAMKLAPAAVNVSLFRPYVWEINKPIILVASIESTLFLLLTLFVFLRRGIISSFKTIFSNPVIVFCLIFAIVFSLAVGLTSGNFGTLMRYKIPMMPFYCVALLLIYNKSSFKISSTIQEL